MPTAARSGRPTDEDLTRRILDATGQLLTENGYADLRVEQVARRAECGKAAIYRRYPDKAALVAAVIEASARVGETPDTGDVRADLLAHALQNQDNQRLTARQQQGMRTMFEPDVFAILWDRFFRLRRAQGITIIDRAIARGEIPDDVDHDIILDTIAGLTLYRQSVKRIHIDARHYVDIIDALVTRPPRRIAGAPTEEPHFDVV